MKGDNCGIPDVTELPGNGKLLPDPGPSRLNILVIWSDERFQPLTEHSM
jgi:hypothetical protein